MCQQLPKQESVADWMMSYVQGIILVNQIATLQGRQGSVAAGKMQHQMKGSMEQLTSKQLSS